MPFETATAVLISTLLCCAILSMQHSIAVEAQMRTFEARLEALEKMSASHSSALEAAEEVAYRMALAQGAADGHLRAIAADVRFVLASDSDLVRPARRLSEEDGSFTQADSATIRVDAPNGTASIVMGGMEASDNLILTKEHERDGALVTLSRNETRVLSIDESGTLSVEGSLWIAGQRVAGSGFENEIRFFLGGLCPDGWTEAIETAGKLLGSRGGSDVAGSSKSTAGISATTTVHYEDYYYLQSNTNPYYNYVGCNTERESHRCDRTATPQVTVTGPDSVALLACKRA